jgi:hypothetical protein
MRPLLDERKENCSMREAVENGFPCEGRVITGLKAGVNEKSFITESMGLSSQRPPISGVSSGVNETRLQPGKHGLS